MRRVAGVACVLLCWLAIGRLWWHWTELWEVAGG